MNNYRLNRNFMDDDRLESIDMPYYGYGGSEIFCKMENRGDVAATVWFIYEILGVISIIVFVVIIRSNK